MVETKKKQGRSLDRDYALGLAMGRSDIGNENYPAWSITSLNGLISGSVPYMYNTFSLNLICLIIKLE